MTSASFDKKVLIKWIISIAIACIPFLFQITEAYSVQLQRFLFATILGIVLLAFELLPSIAIAMLMPLAWVLLGATDFATAFSPYGQANIWVSILAMTFIMVVQDTGILNRIGYYIFVKVKGSFTKAMIALFIACNVITLVSMSSAAILCFALAYALWSSLGLKPTDRETLVLILVTILGSLQSSVYLYCPVSVALINGSVQAVIPDFNLSVTAVMFYNLPVLFVSIFSMMLSFIWYNRGPKSSSIDTDNSYLYFKGKYEELGKLTVAEVKGLILILVAVVILLGQSVFKLDMAMTFLLVLVLCYMPGINIGTSAAVTKVPWETVLLMGTFLAIGNVGATLGLNAIITAFCVPIVSAMGDYWSVLGTTVMSALSNFVLSPFAMLAVLPGPIAQYCLEVGYDILPHIMALYNAKDLIFLPYEYPGYLLLFSFGMITMNNMTKAVCFKSIISLIAVVVVLMPWWSFVL